MKSVCVLKNRRLSILRLPWHQDCIKAPFTLQNDVWSMLFKSLKFIIIYQLT